MLESQTYKCIVRFEKKLFVPLQLLVGVWLCLGMFFHIKWYWLLVICLPLEFVSVSILWWPVIEPANGVLCERALLFGKKKLSERFLPLDEFVEIFYEHTPSDSAEEFSLGLRHKSGRKFWIEGCWSIQRSVEAKAWEISCKTGIKLNEWPF